MFLVKIDLNPKMINAFSSFISSDASVVAPSNKEDSRAPQECNRARTNNPIRSYSINRDIDGSIDSEFAANLLKVIELTGLSYDDLLMCTSRIENIIKEAM